MKLTPSFVFCLVLVPFGALSVYSQTAEEGMSLSDSKPYVYLEFDHIGPRTPLQAGESNRGIWLHLKNNSRFAITVIASADSTWVGDEVVPDAPSPGTESLGDAIGYKPGQEDFTDIYLFPNETEAEVRGAELAVKERSVRARSTSPKRPRGYSGGHEPGPQVLKVIPSGEEILFSLPSDHLSSSWHLEIPFRFAIKHAGSHRPPYSNVALFWDDLPEAYRSAAAATPSSATPPTSALSHKSGHTLGSSKPQ